MTADQQSRWTAAYEAAIPRVCTIKSRRGWRWCADWPGMGQWRGFLPTQIAALVEGRSRVADAMVAKEEQP